MRKSYTYMPLVMSTRNVLIPVKGQGHGVGDTEQHIIIGITINITTVITNYYPSDPSSCQALL
jgi:hypothetical protein